MALDVWKVIEKGFKKTFRNTGTTLIGIFFLIDLIGHISGTSFRQYLIDAELIPVAEGASQSLQFAWIGSPIISGVLMLAVIFASLITVIVTIRVFLKDKKNSIPPSFYKENIFSPAVNLIIGGILYSILITIGIILLILPGVYLILALFFWTVIVLDKNVGFFKAMKKSWKITKGTKTKFSIFLLLIVLALISFIVPLGVGFLVGIVGISETFGSLVVEIIVSSLLTVFQLGVVVEAYKKVIHREHQKTIQNT